MKPCSRNRKRIAWLALGELNPTAASALREHLAQCEGCRYYWQELADVKEALTQSAPAVAPEPSPAFYRKVDQRLQATRPASVAENFAAWFRLSLSDWRIVSPAVVLLAAGVIAMLLLRAPKVNPTSLKPLLTPTASKSNAIDEMVPSIGNYEMVANQSLDKFDELLARQGSKPLNLAGDPLGSMGNRSF